ncbi:MAG: hypothetical protein QXT25_04660 [Candidatus Anstonellaceae archaeon]
MTRKILQPLQPTKKGAITKSTKSLTDSKTESAIEELVEDPIFVTKQARYKRLNPPKSEPLEGEIVSEVPPLLKRPDDLVDIVDKSVKADVKGKLGTASLIGSIIGASSLMSGDIPINQQDAENEQQINMSTQQEINTASDEQDDPIDKTIENEINNDPDKAEQVFEESLQTVAEKISQDPQEATRFKNTLGELLNQTMMSIEQLEKAEEDLENKFDKKIAKYLMLEYLGNAAAAISKYALAYFYADKGTPVNPEVNNYAVSLRAAMEIETKKYQTKLQSLNNQKEALLKNVQKFTELASKEDDRQFMLEKMREEYALKERLQAARLENDQEMMSKYMNELKKLEIEKLQALQKTTSLEKDATKEGREMELDVTKLAKDFAENLAKLPESKREKYVEQMANFLGVPVHKKKVSIAGIELFNYGVDVDKTADSVSKYLGDKAREMSTPTAQKSIENLKTKTEEFLNKDFEQMQPPSFSSKNPKEAMKEIEAKAFKQAEDIIRQNIEKHQEYKVYSGAPFGIKRNYIIKNGQIIWQ